MAGLTQDRLTPERAGNLLVLPMAASSTIFAGSLVAVNGDGFAVPGSTATGLTAAGRAEEAKTNGVTAGAEIVRVRRGTFKFANLEADPVTKLLTTCYIADDQTVAATSGTNTRSVAGKVLAIDADGVWVEI